ncbi:hypothetical protein AS026_21290 [Rhizobium altiplani]|uniref:Uncharacterized protein n=1 Tax=Rhizobium altiplani TaxID=1864509 RepID=A0A109J4E6_9HYPH|nr:hypothetical protein [Rhizobium altiplani]KWV42146.1 hypothetical protein AS026_21290 [Rhizobium altiplani]
MDKIITYTAIVLGIVALVLVVMLRISWSNNDTLKAEKAAIQRKLDESEADLKVSVENHNRIISEKNRQMASERERAEAEQRDAVAHAQILKDVEYATDGTECTRSDPVRRALRGLYDFEHDQGGKALDRLPGAGQSGNAAGMPGSTSVAKP